MLVSASRTYPVAVAEAYDAALAVDIPAWLSKRWLAFPPVKEITGQEGAWGSSLGQTRRMVLADGGSVLETLVVLEKGVEFSYELSEVAGPMKALAAGVTGRFQFEPAGTGVRITWSWDITPAQPLGPPVMPVFGWMWKGYAKQALADLEPILLSVPAR